MVSRLLSEATGDKAKLSRVTLFLLRLSIPGKNWQKSISTIRERCKFMFNNGLFSDVKFVVRSTDGESESKQVIPAHKFVLSISSPVFEAMFYGELAETTDSIELPDCVRNSRDPPLLTLTF